MTLNQYCYLLATINKRYVENQQQLARGAKLTRSASVLILAVPFTRRSECTMADIRSNDPLHGVTLEAMLNKLVDAYGWDGLARRIDINCFKSDPSVSSSLKFLRRTPWARKEVEDLFLSSKLWERD